MTFLNHEKDIYNFSAGPSQLPKEVLQKSSQAIIKLPGAQESILEISHRSSYFQDLALEAKAKLKELLNIPENYDILFLQGGAR